MFLLLTFSVIALLILYLKVKYFTLHGPIPGLSPHFFFGNLIQSGLLQGKSPPQIFAAFKQRYGDIFQFWFGPTRLIVVSNIDDVQHIFNHRNIYDQGDIYIEQFAILVPNGLITLKG
jgi:cytochrome P450